MKVTDLMIGDWVKTNPNCGKLSCGIESNIAMVSEIGFSNFDGMYVSFVGIKGRYYDSELEPIPLTPDILEKNGFVFYHDVFDGIYPMVSIIYGDYKLLVDGGKYINGGENDNIKYVHELQHALKLCKIEKEIVL